MNREAMVAEVLADFVCDGALFEADGNPYHDQGGKFTSKGNAALYQQGAMAAGRAAGLKAKAQGRSREEIRQAVKEAIVKHLDRGRTRAQGQSKLSLIRGKAARGTIVGQPKGSSVSKKAEQPAPKKPEQTEPKKPERKAERPTKPEAKTGGLSPEHQDAVKTVLAGAKNSVPVKGVKGSDGKTLNGARLGIGEDGYVRIHGSVGKGFDRTFHTVRLGKIEEFAKEATPKAFKPAGEQAVREWLTNRNVQVHGDEDFHNELVRSLAQVPKEHLELSKATMFTSDISKMRPEVARFGGGFVGGLFDPETGAIFVKREPPLGEPRSRYMVHEFGHSLNWGQRQDVDAAKGAAFFSKTIDVANQALADARHDKLTSYAKTNQAEAFAEAYTLWARGGGSFVKHRAPKTAKLLEELF